MVSFIVITHSPILAEGVCEEARIMAPDAVIIPAGGTDDGEIGTSINKITSAINTAYTEDGVIILADMGSAIMTARLAVEELDDDMAENIFIADCPLVEGAVLGTVLSVSGDSAQSITDELSHVAENSKLG